MIRAATFAAALLLATSCGQKGPLRLPAGKTAAPGVPAQPTPATPGPATTPPSSP